MKEKKEGLIYRNNRRSQRHLAVNISTVGNFFFFFFLPLGIIDSVSAVLYFVSMLSGVVYRSSRSSKRTRGASYKRSHAGAWWWCTGTEEARSPSSGSISSAGLTSIVFCPIIMVQFKKKERKGRVISVGESKKKLQQAHLG